MVLVELVDLYASLARAGPTSDCRAQGLLRGAVLVDPNTGFLIG
ncbi:MAG: hypothetical protein QOC74_3677 [Pseudonocardiales bacterium]|jgi:hypothetical protein|nr:hypothetical protein [Pseudonocardiales bacterium]